MQRLWLRALLISIVLCGFALLLGLFSGLRPVLWIYWVPGMAAVAYPWVAIRGGFDPGMHPISAPLMMIADVLFWWLVIYVLLLLSRNWRNRRRAQ